ncbi:diphosphoinositol polyphosphate phosphohydrolase 1 Aps [Brevipalpus obovatus]|uniref:diphosphoinositol polyphosphate phosphohydrolase 1 Aps n=1 Tax=Brevipalpus obovatus TaxID=246614 RepID=UPI003D9EC1E6
MVKNKIQTRIYDNDGYRRRAACICVKDDDRKKILLVTSSSSENRWVVPGGGLEPSETSRDAAVREVMEEAGVRGDIVHHHGTFENHERKHRTDVFIFMVSEELSEWEDAATIGRRRDWFDLETAIEALSIHRPLESNYVKLLQKEVPN